MSQSSPRNLLNRVNIVFVFREVSNVERVLEPSQGVSMSGRLRVGGGSFGIWSHHYRVSITRKHR